MPKISDIEETPNPNAVKFILKEPVTNGTARQFNSAEKAEGDPLAKSWARSFPSSTWTG
jgi:hypothetical protein